MLYLDEVIVCVDVVIEESVIVYMNELLIVLSDDVELSWEDCYIQQQCLCIVIVYYGCKYKEDMEVCYEQLIKGGIIF